MGAPTLTDVMETIALLTSRWAIRILRWGTIATLIVVRRWRHLLVFIGALIVEAFVTYASDAGDPPASAARRRINRPVAGLRDAVEAMAGLAVTLVGITYSLIPHGRWRDAAKWATAGSCSSSGIARVYLAVDHPTDAIFGAVLGVAIGLTAFRWFAPNDVFPVTYRRGKAAHLDVGGRRVRRSPPPSAISSATACST